MPVGPTDRQESTMAPVEQCELAPGPDAPCHAGRWAIERTDSLAAEVLAVTLASAVLTTGPARMLLTLARNEWMRITVYGSGPVTEDSLTPVGREVVGHFAVEHGVAADGTGLWAELDR